MRLRNSDSNLRKDSEIILNLSYDKSKRNRNYIANNATL